MELPEEHIQQIVGRVGTYYRGERERHFPTGIRLADEQRRLVESYFPSELLDKVRVVVLKGIRLDPANATVSDIASMKTVWITARSAYRRSKPNLLSTNIYEFQKMTGVLGGLQLDDAQLKRYLEMSYKT